MTPRIVPLVGSRLLPPGVIIDSWGGAPLTLSLTLDAGENISGATQLIAELHTSQKSSSAPLAQTVLAVTDNDGPWDLEFTSAQMNQNTNTADTRIVWLIVVAVYPSRVEPLVGRFVSLHRAAYSGANPLPPPVTVADIIDVENRVTDLEADVATLPATYATINSPVLTGVPTSPTAPASTATTQIASTAFVMSELSAAVSGLLELKGNINAAANPNYPAAQKGDTYYVSAAGKVGGASGKTVEIGDAVIAAADNAGGTEAAVGASWFILEKNMSGALLASNNLSDVSSTLTTLQNLGLSPNITLPGFFHVAGNIGIGTTSPGSALHISGALGTNTSTYDSAAACKLTNTNGLSWLLTSGVIGVVNATFCIRREGVALPALTIDQTNNVGIGTTSPAATAALDITSTTKGFLAPRMTTIQRDAIVSPPIGLIIYDTTANKVSVRVNSEWKYLAYETA